ncbi:hypothetical protein V5O48_015435 [Marasmius crinis-equi]|uniref:Uncharacterized protein n=1 Tax=Marasmius crinis-equi TaxID=585013 RepID=A0ABR3EUK5_9AGAR
MQSSEEALESQAETEQPEGLRVPSIPNSPSVIQDHSRDISVRFYRGHRSLRQLLWSLLEMGFQDNAHQRVYYYYLHNSSIDTIETITALPMLQQVLPLAEEKDLTVIQKKELKKCTLLDTVVIQHDLHNIVLVDSLPSERSKNPVFQYGHEGAFTNSLEAVHYCANIIETIAYESLRDIVDRIIMEA